MVDECSGGCQCRALCFHLVGRLTDASICPCRMCQQACGADPAPLVSACGAAFAWTCGEPQRFAVSNRVKRGFCAEYGTPLSCEAPDGLAIAVGVFDPPWRLPPSIQYGIEGSKASCLSSTACMPCRRDARRTTWRRDSLPASCPVTVSTDHDTADWPPA